MRRLGRRATRTTLLYLLNRKRSTLTIALLLGLLFLALVNRPYSPLYRYLHREKSLFREAEGINRHRTQSAREYFTRVNHEDSFRDLPVRPKAGVRVAIAIITVKRRSPHTLGYVIQSAATLHSILRHQQPDELFSDSALFICNVDHEPDRHQDAVFLENYVTVVKRYGSAVNSSSMRAPGLKKPYFRDVEHNNVYDKERVDYMFCLLSALDFHPDYVLVVEDDAVALPDMPSVVQHALDTLLRRHDNDRKPGLSGERLPSDTHPPNPRAGCGDITVSEEIHDRKISLPEVPMTSGFVYLKLFFPLYWQGFAFELQRLLDLLCMTVVLATVIICCLRTCLLVTERKVNSQRLVSLALVLSLAVCALSGRQNMNELRRVSRYFYRLQTSPECCTPAILYPCDVIPSLVTWLAKYKSSEHVDLCIADFVKQSGLPAYSVEPNLFSHIGTVTSLEMGNKCGEELLFHKGSLHFEN